MQRILTGLASGALALVLGACSHAPNHVPLAYVPADTLFVFANVQPLDPKLQAVILKQFDQQMPQDATRLRNFARTLNDKPHLAALMRALGAEFDGKTIAQFATDLGLDLHGRFAFYAVGLDPVWRVPLADPARFNAFIAKLEKAYGTPLARAEINGSRYRHLPVGDHFEIALVVANQQATVALLPAKAPAPVVSRVLGFDRPQHSLLDSHKLTMLAKTDGYQLWGVGYFDTTRLPALLTADQPMLEAASSGKRSHLLPADCRADLERMAARVPLLSYGITSVSAGHSAGRLNVKLAPDITAALADGATPIAGLGGPTPGAFDVSVALPMHKIMAFVDAQAKAVAAKPFHCLEFGVVNAGFATLAAATKSKIQPPLSDLLGLHVVLDHAPHFHPTAVDGRLLVASSQPAQLLAWLATHIKSLTGFSVKADGKAVALPAPPASSRMPTPSAIAMNEHALILGFGANAGAKLEAMLTAPGTTDGTIARMHVSGAYYADWMQSLVDHMKATQDKRDHAKHGSQPARVASVASRRHRQTKMMVAQIKQLRRIKAINMHVHVGPRGLIVDSSYAWQPPPATPPQ